MKQSLIYSLAVYRYEDWSKLLKISVDRQSLEETWEEWNDNIHKLEDDLLRRNVQYRKITVDIEELEHYCRKSGDPVNPGSRSAYAAWKAAQSEKD
jgi:hypothetical protein